MSASNPQIKFNFKAKPGNMCVEIELREGSNRKTSRLFAKEMRRAKGSVHRFVQELPDASPAASSGIASGHCSASSSGFFSSPAVSQEESRLACLRQKAALKVLDQRIRDGGRRFLTALVHLLLTQHQWLGAV